jgi:hypothetical protein
MSYFSYSSLQTVKRAKLHREQTLSRRVLSRGAYVHAQQRLGILTFGLLFLLLVSAHEHDENVYHELQFQNIMTHFVYFHCRFNK